MPVPRARCAEAIEIVPPGAMRRHEPPFGPGAAADREPA